MENNMIINLFSKYDIKSKFIRVSIENQLARKFRKGFWIILLFYLIVFILDITRVLFFASKDPIKYGGSGYYFGGEKIWFITDLCQDSFNFLAISLLLLYHQDDCEWIINLNNFYNEIRDKNLDTILIQKSNQFMNYSKIVKNIFLISNPISTMIIFALKFNNFYNNPVSYILTFIYANFINLIGFPIVIRALLICLFLNFKYRSRG